MNDVTVIDRFLDTFSRYIDSGFGLLQGEVAFLTATLIVIDMTLAGLFWAMSHASGQGGRADESQGQDGGKQGQAHRGELTFSGMNRATRFSDCHLALRCPAFL